MPREFTKCGSAFTKELTKIGNEFLKNKNIKKQFTEAGADDFFSIKFHQHFHRPLSEWRDMNLSKGDLAGFKSELNLSLKAVQSGKLGSAPAQYMYATSSIVKKFPALAGLVDDYLKVNHTNKGNANILDSGGDLKS